MSAILADGSGKVVWENTTRVYVPSMLAKDGYLYAVLDAGVVTCWKCDDGREMWKQRIGGTFSASPVLVADKIFATNEAGKTYIFKATPDGYSEIAVNQLADEVFATPTICGSRIYMRAASIVDGKRQETLYCLGAQR
jgi:outer membrane protein assembly factor BamB